MRFIRQQEISNKKFVVAEIEKSESVTDKMRKKQRCEENGKS